MAIWNGRYQSIASTSVDLSSVTSSNIILRAFSQQKVSTLRLYKMKVPTHYVKNKILQEKLRHQITTSQISFKFPGRVCVIGIDANVEVNEATMTEIEVSTSILSLWNEINDE